MEININNNQYQTQFDEIKSIIDNRRKRAYKAINNEIILSNWEIGRYVSDKIKSAKWGSKVIDMLVVYLKQTIPGIRGYENVLLKGWYGSTTNIHLWNLRQLFRRKLKSKQLRQIV